MRQWSNLLPSVNPGGGPKPGGEVEEVKSPLSSTTCRRRCVTYLLIGEGSTQDGDLEGGMLAGVSTVKRTLLNRVTDSTGGDQIPPTVLSGCTRARAIFLLAWAWRYLDERKQHICPSLMGLARRCSKHRASQYLEFLGKHTLYNYSVRMFTGTMIGSYERPSQTWRPIPKIEACFCKGMSVEIRVSAFIHKTTDFAEMFFAP